MSINTKNSLQYDKTALKKQPVVERLSFFFGKLLTSTLLIIIVMVSFLIGVSTHLAEVFESWFLAIGMQAVILIASTNSDILPKVKIGNGTLTLIPFVMSMLMTWYLFISFHGLQHESNSVEFWTALSKALGLASTEYMFSYLFTFRFNKFMSDLNDLKKIEDSEKFTDSQKLSLELADKHIKETPPEVLEKQMAENDLPFQKDIWLVSDDGGSPNIKEVSEQPEAVIEEIEPEYVPKVQPKPVKTTNQGLL